MNRLLSRLSLAVIVISGAFLPGCLLYTRNVTSSYETDYEVGQVYALRQEAMVFRRDDDSWFRRLTLDLPRYDLESPSGPQYEAVDGKVVVSNRAAATLPVGSRLRYVGTVYYYFFEGSEVLPLAVILDGPMTGTRVDLGGISRVVPDANGFDRSTGVNPVWLEEVD